MARLKQLRINTSGALILMQDVEIIYGCFALPPLAPTAVAAAVGDADANTKAGAAVGGSVVNAPEVKAAFNNLKEVAGLFCVEPQNLKGLMEHGYLSTQDRGDLFILVSNRADFRSHGFMAPWVKTVFGPDVRDEGTGGATSPVPPDDSPQRQRALGSPTGSGLGLGR